jgi:SprB repeat
MKPVRQINIFRSLSLIFLLVIFLIYSCSKSSGGSNPSPPDPCAGVSITVSGTVVNPSSAGANDGSITATAAGGSGLSFNINGGSFQASGNFTGLGPGSYTITAKSSNGCTGSTAFTLTGPNVCTGVAITVSNAVTNNSPCLSAASGSITVTPGGGTGPYTFRLNGGTFQSTNIFSGLTAGFYTITVKDANGCTGSSNATVSDFPAGALFLAVRTVLQNNCVSCHNSTVSEGGMNWTVDCNIVTFKDRIKIRAVDGNPSPMPPTGFISVSEQQKIINWINAGGKFSD